MLIIHGDDQIASRQVFLDARQNSSVSGRETVTLNGLSLNLSSLVNRVRSISLLGQTTSIFIENFFSRRPGQEKKAITQYLLSNTGLEVTVWESKNQTSQLSGFPPACVRCYSLPKTVFRFLDTFSVSDLALALKSNPPEQLLTMVAGHIHKLILVKEGAAQFPAWQQAKLKNQLAKYSFDRLKYMHQSLIELDFLQKTSSTPLDLTSALELWVLSL